MTADGRAVLEVAGIRAGAAPGTHLVSFDGTGESIELRLDRPRPLGLCRAAPWPPPDWLVREPRDARHPPVRRGRRRPARRVAPGGAGVTTTDHASWRNPPCPRPSRSAARSPRSSPRSRPTGPSTRPPSARSSRWQVLAGIDGLVPSARPARRPRCPAGARPAHRDRPSRPPPNARVARPVRVVAGTGTNDTAATIGATRRAAELGADAALVVAPYYNRPDSRMLDAHFRAIADEGGLPIVVYNVPVADGRERGGRHVPAARRAPARRRGQGGERQPRPDRPDLPRPAARRGGHGRRRRLDAAGPRDGRRRRGVRGAQRDPRRAGRAVRRGPGRRLGRRAGGSTSAGCRCSGPTSVAARTRCRPRPRCWRWACSRRDTVRAPLLPLADAAAAMAVELLRRSGWSSGGGRCRRGVAARRRCA